MKDNENKITDLECPICSNKLFTDGKYVWCSKVGSFQNVQVDSCSFGVREERLLKDYINGNKILSAWELFVQLENKYNTFDHNLYLNWIHYFSQLIIKKKIMNEKEAIEIMHKIDEKLEKMLKNA